MDIFFLLKKKKKIKYYKFKIVEFIYIFKNLIKLKKSINKKFSFFKLINLLNINKFKFFNKIFKLIN